MARLITKTDVACERSFLSLTKLMTVTRFPEMPSEERRQAKIPVARVADSVSASPLMSASEEAFSMFGTKSLPPLNCGACIWIVYLLTRVRLNKLPACRECDPKKIGLIIQIFSESPPNHSEIQTVIEGHFLNGRRKHDYMHDKYDIGPCTMHIFNGSQLYPKSSCSTVQCWCIHQVILPLHNQHPS